MQYPEEYLEQAFYVWYNLGKPGAKVLQDNLPKDVYGLTTKPSTQLLSTWIEQRFVPRAENMDNQVRQSMEQKIVAEKIKMMERHTKIAERMQDIGMRYLEENEDKLNANVALKVLVEGVRIERESRGIPEMFQKVQGMSDDKLLEELENLVKKSPILSIENKKTEDDIIDV